MHISAKLLHRLQHLLGENHVLTDDIALALNGYDCSPSQHRPNLVLTLSQADQLAEVLKYLTKERIPFIARAAGTNHAGSCAALHGGAVLNLNYLNKIHCIHTQQGWAEVDPCVVTGHLQQALAPLGFFYAPDPASEHVSTLGGNLAQNASGARCMKYGNTCDNTLQAEIVLSDGTELTVRHDNPGPDWLGLLAGSEGTLAVVKRLWVKIQPIAAHLQTFLITFASLEECVQTVTDLVAQGLTPRCVEAMDRITIQTIENFCHAGYPDAPALLILELDGSLAQIKKDAAVLEKICQQNHCQNFVVAKTEQDRKKLWRGRQAAYSAMAALAPNVAVGDGTVPRSRLPQALKQVRQVLEKYGLTASLLFHAGDGNFHPQLVFDGRIAEQTWKVHNALQEILKICVDCGGTISGEHGIGIEKRNLMAYQYSRQTLQFFQTIKRAFDPLSLANPGKILPIHFAENAALHQETEPAVCALQQEIQQRFSAKKPSAIKGSGSIFSSKAHALSTLSLNKICEIDTHNYTATVQAGVPISRLIQELKKHRVFAKLPTDYVGTLGGLVATKASVDFITQLLAVQAILPNGDIVQYGAKVMKNAAGYNLCRLFAGSWGSLGLITQLTFKIYANKQTVSPVQKKCPVPDILFKAVKQEIDKHHLFISPVFQQDLL